MKEGKTHRKCFELNDNENVIYENIWASCTYREIYRLKCISWNRRLKTKHQWSKYSFEEVRERIVTVKPKESRRREGNSIGLFQRILKFYEDLQDLLELTPKKDVLFIIGDWIEKVGSQKTLGVTGKFGLGIRNEAGQRLIEFCQENTLVITNTLFQQHQRRLYTWT